MLPFPSPFPHVGHDKAVNHQPGAVKLYDSKMLPSKPRINRMPTKNGEFWREVSQDHMLRISEVTIHTNGIMILFLALI